MTAHAAILAPDSLTVVAPARGRPPVGLLVLPGLALLVLGLFLPLGQVLWMSLNPPEPGVIAPVAELTLANYARLMRSDFYLGIVVRTLWLSALTTLLTAVFGMVLGLSVWRARPSVRGMLLVMILAPLLVSIVARTYGWVVLLGDKGALNSVLMALGLTDEPLRIMYTQPAVLIGLVHVFLPFMVLSLLGALDRIDPSLTEAAATLGASRWHVFRHVILPLSVPGLASGTIIVFSLSMSSYVTPALMGGSRSGLMTTFIYQQFSVTMNWHFGATMVAVLLAATLALLLAVVGWSRWYTRQWSLAR
ncbi:putative spermidine/putrescine transport system permease protein [Pseudacidovorax intermedius]|uniref:Putative spermidine/putrescine transport system permease protein n=2 Tax=Pseudacidovorax intermedius TaxID=433924 RepID=A0A370FHL6_9BURK|nr:ABC transporter permease [Pseudacidovorax intermedius]RDI26234.1 putative spermidine/putrescine transport system permease protein [Pseudacidovorax intermedius]